MGYSMQMEFSHNAKEYTFIWNYDNWTQLEESAFPDDIKLTGSIESITALDLFDYAKQLFDLLDNGYLWIVKIKMPSGITYGYYKEIDTQQTADDLYNHFMDIFEERNKDNE